MNFSRKSWWDKLCEHYQRLQDKGKHALPPHCVFCHRINMAEQYKVLGRMK